MKVEAINVEKELKRFFKEVVRQSRENLKKDGSNASGRLSRNLGFTVKENKNSFETSLDSPELREYVNTYIH